MARSGKRSPSETHSLSNDVVRIFFGPWPIRPVLSLIVFFVAYMFAQNVFADVNPDNFVNRLPRPLPSALLIAGATSAVLYVSEVVLRRTRGGNRPTRGVYLIVMTVAGLVLGMATFIQSPMFDPSNPDFQGVLYYLIRGVLLVTLLHAVAGVNDARLQANVRIAERALEEVNEQRRAVIDAEERARESIARFLHDHVQTGLVSISLLLRPIVERTPEPEKAQLGSIIEALEDMRTIEVRAASRRLSPDIAATGLRTALVELLEGYGGSLDGEVSIADELSAWARPDPDAAQQHLAVYRVVEQAVLNSAIHGRARRVWISIDDGGDTIDVQVLDDGVGLPPGGHTPGSGSTIISAWVSSFGGQWRLDPRASAGAWFRATFPK